MDMQDKEDHYSIIDMLDVLLAAEYEHAKQLPCLPRAPRATSRCTESVQRCLAPGWASSPTRLQSELELQNDPRLHPVFSPQGPTTLDGHLTVVGGPTWQPPTGRFDGDIKDAGGPISLPSLLVQLDQTVRQDPSGEALVQVLQTCEYVLSLKSEPKVRVQDRAVEATQGVLKHLLSSKMAFAFGKGVQDGRAVEPQRAPGRHGTLRPTGCGRVLQDLYACVQGCALQDLFPLAYCLTSCVSDLAEKVQEVQADLRVMSTNWSILHQKLQHACRAFNSVASDSPVCGDAFDLETWMQGLVPEAEYHGASMKFSDGIAANAGTGGDGFPAAKQFYPAEFHPSRFLAALKDLTLEASDQYSMCCVCNVITKDFEEHCKRSPHGVCDRRHPTMDDIVQQAVDFAKRCRSDRNKHSACHTLEDDDIYALYVYTLETGINSQVNAAMRRDVLSSEDEKWTPIIYHIQRALRKLPPHSLTPLYRSINCKVTGYDEGRLLLWQQFSSATASPHIAKDLTGKGGSLFILRPSEASQGHPIDFLSECEKEMEVLFSHNTWFRVQQKLKDGAKRFLAQHLGLAWEVMKEIDVYELHEVTEDVARQEHAMQQHKAAQQQEGAQLLAQRASKSLVDHILEGNAEACLQDIRDGADVQQVHQGASLMALAAMKDMHGVCAEMAPQVQGVTIAPSNSAAAEVSKVFAQLPEGLTSLLIGEGNLLFEALPRAASGYRLASFSIGDGSSIGAEGALAIASKGHDLRSLHIGRHNGLGLDGVKQILHGCTRLQDISIGGWHAVSDRSVVTECSTITALDAAGKHMDEDGEFLIATLYPSLCSIILDCCTDVGAEAIATRCSLLTSVNINSITGGGAAAIAANCTSLRSLSIGDANHVGEDIVRAIAEHGTSLTSLSIGDVNSVGAEGARAIAERCSFLTSLNVGDSNHIGADGALAIASKGHDLRSFHIGRHNGLGLDGVKQILHGCTRLQDISIGGWHAVSDRSVVTECSTITALDAAGKHMDEDGEFLIATLYPSLCSIILDCCTDVGAEAIATQCSLLTSVNINSITGGGAAAIAANCTSLRSLSIGSDKKVAEAVARVSVRSLSVTSDKKIAEAGARAATNLLKSFSIDSVLSTIDDGRIPFEENVIGEGGARSIAQNCTSLTSLRIGDGSSIGADGAVAIASKGHDLRSLHIGRHNGLGLDGVKQILHGCTRLQDISIGGWHAVSDRSVVTECSTITALDAAGKHMDEDGEFLIATLYPSLCSIILDCCTDVGAEAIATQCSLLTSVNINSITGGGAAAIAANCTSLRSLSIGDANHVGEDNVRAIAEHGTSLTSLSIGDVNSVGAEGARAIAERCLFLTSLNVGDANNVDAEGALAIAEHCTSLTFLSLGNSNNIGEGGAQAIANCGGSLKSLSIGCNNIGEVGTQAVAQNCTSLTSLSIGDGNYIDEGGAQAIADNCTSLTSLCIGNDNNIREGGARAIAKQCVALVSLVIGDNNAIRGGGVRAIATYCASLTSLSIGYNRIGEHGALAIAGHCTSLTSLSIGYGNNIGERGARAIAESCTSLLSFSIGYNDIGEGGAQAIAEQCTSLTSLSIGYNKIDEGGARAIAKHCTSLTSLRIGRSNNISEGGARAVAERCISLTSLNIGHGNNIREGGARAIADNSVSLTSLSIGSGNDIGEGGARAIAEHCTSLTSLSVGSNDIGEGGARAVAENCASLTSLSIGHSNDIGEQGAQVIAERCAALTSLSIGDDNNIGGGGARAIAGHCASLTSLSIGHSNLIGEAGARAVAARCTSLTSLSIGNDNDIGECGAQAIATHCASLASLTIGEDNSIGEGGARAIAEHCAHLTSLSIGNDNDIGEAGARAIAEQCTSLTSLRIWDDSMGAEGRRILAERHPDDAVVTSFPRLALSPKTTKCHVNSLALFQSSSETSFQPSCPTPTGGASFRTSCTPSPPQHQQPAAESSFRFPTRNGGTSSLTSGTLLPPQHQQPAAESSFRFPTRRGSSLTSGTPAPPQHQQTDAAFHRPVHRPRLSGSKRFSFAATLSRVGPRTASA